MNAAKVFLVGAGPGDAGLLTLRGAELLRTADVVIYDGLVNRELLKHAPARAELIYAGKHDRTRCVSQELINRLLVGRARQGKRVVRLKGGDPYLFGRGAEEAEALVAAGIPLEVVPGVSSVQSVPCYAGIPLMHRDFNSAVTLVTGHEDPEAPGNRVRWDQVAQSPGTLVILMGLKHLRAIANALMASGRSCTTPAAVISHGTTSRQQTVTGTLATVADEVEREHIHPPALIVIGEVVRLREKLNWFEKRPLLGRRVVVTQRLDLAAPLVAALEARGAEVWQLPATRWFPHPDLDQALVNLKQYDWILFSHQLGVQFFFERLRERFGDLRSLGNARLGAYGPLTGKAIQQWHLTPVAVAADHKTPLIMDAVLKHGPVRGQKFLVIRGDEAQENVPETLEQLGARVDVARAFAVAPEQRYEPLLARLRDEGADWLVFASGLAIEHLDARLDLRDFLARFPATRLALASGTVEWALEARGLHATVVAQPNDAEDLATRIAEGSASKIRVGTRRCREPNPNAESRNPKEGRDPKAERFRAAFLVPY
jgi:uroporphyrinogen III methyltransferase / synthase